MRGSRHTILLALVVALALPASAARAADHGLAGTRLMLKSGRSQKLLYLYKGQIDTVPGSTLEPKIYGATLRVINPVSGETAVFDLPAANWSGPDTDDLARRVRKYKDPRGSASPVKTVIFKPTKGLKLAARSTGITLDEPTQGSVGVVLSMRNFLNYCSVFGGTVAKDQPGRFIARRATAPGFCPGPSPCGNGVVDGGEDCEGTGAGQCGAEQTCAGCQCVGVGDLSIQLAWSSRDDVDLHVIDPNGEEIYWDHETSASGGQLDADANRGCEGTTTPLENVFWAAGTAPSGQYTVLVHLYRVCDGTPTQVPFTVRTLVDGVSTEYPGVLTNAPSCTSTCQACGACTQVVQFTR
jgi:hypothetical protein